MQRDGFTLTVTVGPETVLEITSDGLAGFTVSGSRLRAPVYGQGLGAPGYPTGDDAHVLGLVAQQLSALVSLEVLQRALTERAKVVPDAA